MHNYSSIVPVVDAEVNMRNLILAAALVVSTATLAQAETHVKFHHVHHGAYEALYVQHQPARASTAPRSDAPSSDADLYVSGRIVAPYGGVVSSQ
jgi:hypothetical protein